MRRTRLVLAPLLLAALVGGAGLLGAGPATGAPAATTARADAPPRVLVWGGAYGFRHPSITQGEVAFTELAQETGAFTATVTENPADLSMAVLRDYDVLVWISTTGKPPMTEQQRDEVIRWSACGGGNLGFHATLDSEYGWAEHAELFGAQFDSHPKGAGSGEARMIVEDDSHPVTEGWKGKADFMFDDEYYRWRTAKRVPGVSLPRNDPGTHVLLSLDETTVGGDIQDGPLAYEHHQPIAWTKTFRDGGRVYYNNMGHSDSTWSEAPFRTSLVNGIDWVSQVRPDAACLDGDEDVSTRLTPPDAATTSLGRPCAVPALGTRSGGTWETSGETRALTVEGDSQDLAAGIPGNLSWGAQTWVLDLSASKALAADVTVDLTWPVPTDDYDLSVTTGWGVYGSDSLVGATSEQVVMTDVPHCAILHVAGDNLLATSQQPPSLKVAVEPKALTALPVAPAVPPTGPTAPAPTGNLAATGAGAALPASALLLLCLGVAARRRAARSDLTVLEESS